MALTTKKRGISANVHDVSFSLWGLYGVPQKAGGAPGPLPLVHPWDTIGKGVLGSDLRRIPAYHTEKRNVHLCAWMYDILVLKFIILHFLYFTLAFHRNANTTLFIAMQIQR